MLGPGKYDAECTQAREAAKATGALLVIFEGDRGFGFSVQGPLPMIAEIPQVLRVMADKIEADTKALSERLGR
jgi:hypothetical protein